MQKKEKENQMGSSRPIRFRAWDTKVKRMYNDIHTMPNFVDFLDDKYMQVMQYTGVIDKNGKEIYEGDIVAPQDKEDASVAIIIIEGGCVRKKYIEWEDRTLEYPVWGDIDSEVFVVVGNIFENPELLNENNLL